MKYWTENRIGKEIMEVAKALMLDRMPTRNEIQTMYRNNGLDCAICKNGGYKHWANKLNLAIKESETSFGQEIESRVIELLKERFGVVESTSTKYPYDILVDGVVKIDVKAARSTLIRGYEAFSFRIAKKQPTCDFYVLVEVNDLESIERIMIVPSGDVTGQVQICVGSGESKYDKYIDRWDMIRQLLDFYKEKLSLAG